MPVTIKGVDMKTGYTNYEYDKKMVLDFMQSRCLTHRNARNLATIQSFVAGSLLTHAKDVSRYVRRILSELKHDGHTCSTNTFGYWAKPLSLHTYSHEEQHEEIKAEKFSALEDHSRAMKMLDGCKKELDRCEDLLASMTYQPTLPGFESVSNLS